MFAPMLIYMAIFKVAPIWGLLMSFQEYNPFKGFWQSEWVGFKHFATLFQSAKFGLMMRNTIAINTLKLVFFFPVPILMSVMLNEIKSERFKRFNQTIVYMPHFLSWVVIASFTFFILSQDIGIINKIRMTAGYGAVSYLTNPRLFWGILISQNLWKDAGWGTILFLAAMAGIDPTLYEAAVIDGAGRFKRIWHITLPSIRGTIVTMLILRLGQMFSVGFEQILLMQNPLVYDISEVLDTYIYTQGIRNGKISSAVAVGMFKSAINILMVVSANRVVRLFGESGIY
jgi:putative aldouronate transport system permease protein